MQDIPFNAMQDIPFNAMQDIPFNAMQDAVRVSLMCPRPNNATRSRLPRICQARGVRRC